MQKGMLNGKRILKRLRAHRVKRGLMIVERVRSRVRVKRGLMIVVNNKKCLQGYMVEGLYSKTHRVIG